MLERLWLPIIAVSVALYWLLKPMYRQFDANRKKEQTKPETYHLTR